MIRILTVCTGNICRSPYAELFLQSELNRLSPRSFDIQSAGTHALAGHQMDDRASNKLRDIGISADGFSARQLTSDMASEVDLVLALTDAHRSQIVQLSPKLLKRTYTIREFAAVLVELMANSSVSFPSGNRPAAVLERWVTLLKIAPLNRHSARMKLSGSMDVVDPYRQNDAVYERMVDELLPSLRTIVEFELAHATQV
ncbi:arsenate reductase/protein-tyrosine-phosphatase family protein [Paeniglutamicibacter gangotriensis]|uniref:Protein tyrosine phosphatase n=1 Tax=Paeniglutamicibacter gangotriensis Lz1y TaxID=1276920 RepID=M7MX72_9MICC|nr:low molecular weight phosphatase family protein [Paeniglutamicibacter gangotriensis]EMQ99555.1 protein tyrosine phosphatase [Paeniglutamicibacter gangotriensis Lz1y]